jgi:hypothetical protein
MSFDEHEVLGRFHRALVRELRAKDPHRVDGPFTVAEIYQDLVPYRTHRDQIGVAMNADYEHALLRLLAGEGDYLSLESRTAREEIKEELASPNPNTGLYRDFAAADVHLNPELLGTSETGGSPEEEAVEGGPVTGDDVVGDIVMEGVETVGESEAMAVENGLEKEEVGTMDETLEGVEYERLEIEPVGANLGPVEDDSEGEVASERVHVEVSAESEDQEDQEGNDAEEVDLPPFENCPWCRENLPQQARVRFCPFCGSNVQLVPCPSCGEELRLNWRFCIACGTEVES